MRSRARSRLDRGAAPEPGGVLEAPGGRRAARRVQALAASRARERLEADPAGDSNRREGVTGGRGDGAASDEGTDEDVPSRLVGGVASGTPIVDGGRRTDASVEESRGSPRARRARPELRSFLSKTHRWAWSSCRARTCATARGAAASCGACSGSGARWWTRAVAVDASGFVPEYLRRRLGDAERREGRAACRRAAEPAGRAASEGAVGAPRL